MNILTESRFLKVIPIMNKGQGQTPKAHLENTQLHQWSKMESPTPCKASKVEENLERSNAQRKA